MNISQNKILELIEFNKTQQHPTDMRVELEFLRCHNPTHVVELGTCHAGWPLTVNKVLKFDEKTLFTLIETFAGNEYNWIKHRSDDYKTRFMQATIKKKSQTLNYNLKFDNIVETIDKDYDVFRYDGYSDYKTFKNFIDKATDNALIIVHDQNFVNEFQLSLYSIKYMIDHSLYPLYFGTFTGIFCKNKDYKETIFKKLNFSDLFDENRIRFHETTVLDTVFDIDTGKGFYTARA